ncbi:MAG: BamA/TamA family outer membrane protein [Pseudobdellovibrionaceae bacterium]
MAFWVVLFFSIFQVAADETQICPHILAKGTLRLNANEKMLVCGSDRGPEGWREIPIPQAQLELKLILQNLGYFNPQFERQGEQLLVWPGLQTLVKTLEVSGSEGLLDPDKKRKIVNAPLIPGKLDEVNSWANIKVRSAGYACPEIKVTGSVPERAIQTEIYLDSKKNYGPLETDGLSGLHPSVLDRYQPFYEGDPYNVIETQIMTSRMLSDGLFQSASLSTECSEDKALLKLLTSIGKPRILRFGVGGSTEEAPFVDLSFKNAQLDKRASSVAGSLHGSPRLLRLSIVSEFYLLPRWSRTFFGPRFKIERKTETAFEVDSAQIGVDLGQHWDAGNIRLNARVGPTLNKTLTRRGVGPEEAQYPTFEGSLSVMNHVYETSIRDQYEGWNGSFAYRGQRKGLGSKVDVNHYEFNYKYLWNIGAYSPPLFVLANRLEGVVVDADDIEQTETRTLIPVEDRIYMGGDQNLRGFPRASLNNRDLGYLTSLYLGLELRLIAELPYRLEPFLLFDSARFGDRRYTLDRPLFLSEGGGLRWASPVGTFRLSAARGRVIHKMAEMPSYPEQWVYFFSFGQEF